MSEITIPIPDPIQPPAQAAAAESNQAAANSTQGNANMAAPDLGDLNTIFASNAAQAAQTQMAVSDQIRNQAAYAMQVDNRLVTGAVAAQIAAAGEPDAFAGLNTGIRTPVTLDQPGAWPANAQVKA